MEATDPHAAFGGAYRFLATYILHAQRLLRDCKVEVERNGFQMLRQNGDRLISSTDLKLDEPEHWLPDYLFTFFAPAAAFRGKTYGVLASDVSRVPFLGLALDTLDDGDTNAPGLWLGWLERHSPEGLLETQLAKDFLWEIDPEKLEACHEPVADVAQLSWSASRHPSGRSVTLNRIPLRLIRSHDDAKRIVESLLFALKEPTSPSP